MANTCYIHISVTHMLYYPTELRLQNTSSKMKCIKIFKTATVEHKTKFRVLLSTGSSATAQDIGPGNQPWSLNMVRWKVHDSIRTQCLFSHYLPLLTSMFQDTPFGGFFQHFPCIIIIIIANLSSNYPGPQNIIFISNFYVRTAVKHCSIQHCNCFSSALFRIPIRSHF